VALQFELKTEVYKEVAVYCYIASAIFVSYDGLKSSCIHGCIVLHAEQNFNLYPLQLIPCALDSTLIINAFSPWRYLNVYNILAIIAILCNDEISAYKI